MSNKKHLLTLILISFILLISAPHPCNSEPAPVDLMIINEMLETIRQQQEQLKIQAEQIKSQSEQLNKLQKQIDVMIQQRSALPSQVPHNEAKAQQLKLPSGDEGFSLKISGQINRALNIINVWAPGYCYIFRTCITVFWNIKEGFSKIKQCYRQPYIKHEK